VLYRDFVYMDTERIQSIIAQLEQGVLEKVMEGKTSELQGKAGIAAGVLASFLPVELGGSFSRKQDVQSSKVLHDYAFNMALDSLHENDLCLEVQEWDRDSIPLPETAFILARGSMSILDYALLKSLAENERTLDRLFSTPQQSQQSSGQKKRSQSKGKPGVIQQMWTFVDAFMGDSLQVRLKCTDEIIFAGTLSRDFLREDTRGLIFKYGGKPQEGWTMLAQICQITTPSDKLGGLSQLLREFPGLAGLDSAVALTEVINRIVQILNALQEAVASVSYPAIAVTPVALYRELEALR
jgi:hypothetical protein